MSVHADIRSKNALYIIVIIGNICKASGTNGARPTRKDKNDGTFFTQRGLSPLRHAATRRQKQTTGIYEIKICAVRPLAPTGVGSSGESS